MKQRNVSRTPWIILAAVLAIALALGCQQEVAGQEQMSEEDVAEIKQLFEDQQATWGFVSRYGRTGRIRSVQADEKTLEITTPKGSLRVKVGDDTNISKPQDGESRPLAFEDLKPGTLITVDGASGTAEGANAGEIEVIPEGEGGFDITPSESSGPRAVPLFP